MSVGRLSIQKEDRKSVNEVEESSGKSEFDGYHETEETSDHQTVLTDEIDFTKININSDSLKEVAFESGLIHLTWPTLIETESDTFPESYRCNSNKEKLLLWYAENFRRQYHFVHTERKPLFLAVENECGTQKMVCTAIRPTMLPYPEFYTWQGCASFVADHITYKPLERFTSIPRLLSSPWTVVNTQEGHCFEMSTLLVSYLAGSGFEAYAIYGYATAEVCRNDRTRTVCPSLVPKEEEIPPIKEENEPKYVIKPPKDLRSKFILEMEARELKKIEEEKQRALEEEMRRIEELEKPPPDPLYARRVHSWVVVLPGKRDVSLPFFIEPSTGVYHDLSSPFYLGLESIWDHCNYWVNLQKCTAGCRDLQFNLSDTDKWEHVLVAEPWNLIKDGIKVDDMDTGEDAKLASKHLDMPVSWSMKPSVNHIDYEKRYPGGTKTILYKKAKMESFAPHLQSDGLITRVTTFENYDWTDPQWVYEYYSNRKDHLDSKKHNIKADSVIEAFSEGRNDALQEHVHTLHGNTVENFHKMMFYYKSRYDCLEVITLQPFQLTEEFKGRSDYLYYRNADYGQKVRVAGAADSTKRPVLKVIECYHRNSSKTASKDIAKVEYAISENKIKIQFHYEEGKITAASREFIKPEVGEIVFSPELTKGYTGDLDLPPEKQVNLFYLLQHMAKEEERTLLHLREIADEMTTLLKGRLAENSSPKLQVSIFDLERNEETRVDLKEKDLQKKQDSAREVEEEVDYLAPFLARLGDPQALTVEQGWAVRSDCLADYKQLLASRESRMLSELDSQTLALAMKHKWYKENQDTMTHEKEEEYSLFCHNVDSFLRTLAVRLQRHRTLSSIRYKKLESVLDKDPRLSILYENT